MQTAGSFARANSTASATATPSDQVTGRPPSMTDEVDTKQLKVAELREALSSRGLSAEGRKPELMARLQPVLNSERTAMSAAVQEHAAHQLPQQQEVELAPEEVVAKVVALQEAVALDEVAEAAVAEAVDFIQSGAHHPVAAHAQRVVAVGGQKREHEDVIMADVFDATEHTSHDNASAIYSDATAETTINNQAEIQQSSAVTATTTAVSAQHTSSSSAIHQTTSTSWDTQFTKLKQYKSLHGNTKIPKSYPPDPSLGRWVNTQRYKNNTNQLNHVKKAKLDAIGFEWNLRNPNRPWKKWIKELQEYKLQYGHVDVPQRDPNHKELGAFVSNLRGEYRKYNRGQTSSLDPKRIHSLEEIGFHWSTGRGRGKISWETRVSQLKHYKEKFGDFNVPKGWVENVGLGDWVEKQRMQYKRAILTPEQVRELEELGFNFTDQDMLAELTKYRQEFGHCDVPIDWEINPSLGAWVDSQRKTYKKQTKERLLALIELGFDFKATAPTNNHKTTLPILQPKRTEDPSIDGTAAPLLEEEGTVIPRNETGATQYEMEHAVALV